MIVHDYKDSSSESRTETLSGSQNFTIRGYSSLKGMGPGNYISSDSFSAGGYDWNVLFYPDGKKPEHSMYVSMYVRLESEATNVEALFELTLFDQSGKGNHKVNSQDKGPYILKHRRSMWGYNRFFSRANLETSDYIKDDCIAIHCTVGVLKTHVDGPKQYSISVPPSDMGLSLGDLQESEIGYDIIFQIGDETFKANKLMLAARSTVFRDLFNGFIGYSNVDKVVLEDIEPSIFKALLMFIYSDKLPEIHEIMGSASMCTSTIMVQHLLAAADRFCLDQLKELCEAKLCEEVNADIVTTLLSLAEQHQCPHLKAICVKFAAINLEGSSSLLNWNSAMLQSLFSQNI
ncbi:BTB/POZ and MATH domain-containing protein 3-like [Cornus florida]|uniref:BTB/POZ and MATH domain-containing protein 3-like n=1 Tax=Cornus florida TaxID=4283 RepID=UPI0028977A15|nr:BTB/POZ and MATH domain-containing protein 3-like [Cornus florida]